MEPCILAAFADEADKMIEGQITALKRNGIAALEIRGVDGRSISNISLSDAKEVRRKLDDSGIRVWSVGSPIGKTELREDFTPHYDRYLHTLEIAGILGAGNLRLFSFYHTGYDITDALRDAVLERMERFADGAKGTGITLCHENEKGIYGDKASRCAVIHRAIPGIRAVFDPANYAECGEDTLAAWDTVCGYVKYLHIKDVAADGTVVPAGHGICRIPELIGKYREAGGSVLTLEPHLTVFDGFAGLEKEDAGTKIAAFRYPTAGKAFDAAADSLRNILKS